ncbi:hypothetical protein D3C72_927470 [compost metagenome]
MIGDLTGGSVSADGDDVLLTRKEASAFLAQLGVQLKPATLARIWSVGSDGPPCRHIRSRPYYPRGLLRAWALTQISEIRSRAPEAAQARPRAKPR